MIFEVDEALRKLLEKEMPIRKNEIEIAFDQPKRDWSSRVNKPTLNFFLYDFVENVELRGSEQWERIDNTDGTVSFKRNPVRVNLYYLVTAWAKEILDEHKLLSSALVTLLRQPFLEESYLPKELKEQPVPVRLEVAQGHQTEIKVHELWNSIDNDLHPGIRLMVTLSVNPYAMETSPKVATTEMRFSQRPDDHGDGEADETVDMQAMRSKTYFAVSGTIKSKKYSPSSIKLVVVETGKEIPVEEDGSFRIHRLHEGEYHLDLSFNDRVLKHQKIDVPSPEYEITV